MTRMLASIALLALLAAGRAVGAAETTGWITHLDRQDDQIVLDDGRVFVISEEINFSSLKDGVKVRIRYDDIGSDKIAREILPAPDAPHVGKSAPDCGRDHMAKKKNMSVPHNAFC